MDNRRNLLFNYAGVLTTVLVGFLTTPFLIRAIGVEAFGALGVLAAVTSYAQLLDLGIGLAGMKLISEHRLPASLAAVNRIASNVLAAYTALSVVVLAVGLLLAPALIGAFAVPPELHQQFTRAFYVSLVGIAVVLSSASFTGMLLGIGEFKRLNLALMVQAVSASVGNVVVARLTHDLLAVTLWTMLVSVGMWVAKLLILRSRCVRPDPRRVDRQEIRHVLTFSSSTFVISVASRMIFEADALVIGLLASVTSVGLYTAASNPVLALRRVGEQLTTVVLTSSSRLHAEGRRRELRELTRAGMKYSALIMFPVVAAVVVMSRDFLSAWVGPRFSAAAPSLILLTVAVAVYSVQTTPAQILLSTGRQRLLAGVMIGEATSNIALSVVLLPRIGITGVALATLVPSILVAAFLTVPLALRDLELRLTALAGCFWSPALGSALSGAALWGVLRVVPIDSLPEVLLAGAGFLVVYTALVLVVDRDVRGFLRPVSSST